MWTTIIKTLIYKEVTKVWIASVQLYSLVMVCFASLIASFGGFFASGVKRALNVKDFSQSIPGHGGLTDRFDCQLLMGVFSSTYYQSFIKTYNLKIGTILTSVINNLSLPDQLELLEHILIYFVNQGNLDPTVLQKCGASALTEGARQTLESSTSSTSL